MGAVTSIPQTQTPCDAYPAIHFDTEALDKPITMGLDGEGLEKLSGSYGSYCCEESVGCRGVSLGSFLGLEEEMEYLLRQQQAEEEEESDDNLIRWEYAQEQATMSVPKSFALCRMPAEILLSTSSSHPGIELLDLLSQELVSAGRCINVLQGDEDIHVTTTAEETQE